jgi:hypothetical protein
LFEYILYHAIIGAQVIAQVNIEINELMFGPGMHRNMTFTKTYHSGKTAGFKIMIDLSEGMQLVFIYQCVDGIAERFILMNAG